MINSIFGTSIDGLQKKSDSILDIFNKTVRDLTDVNKKIDDEVLTRRDQQAKLEEELKQLDIMRGKNDNVIGKIKVFFDPDAV